MSTKQPAKRNTPKQPNNRLRRANPVSTSQGSQLGGISSVNGFNLDGLPDHPTTQTLRQAAVLQMQQRQGNSYLQRVLTPPNSRQVLANPTERSEEAQKGEGDIQTKPGHKLAVIPPHQQEIQAEARPIANQPHLPEEINKQIQRATDRKNDGDDFIELTIPDGAYVLEAANIPAKANWELTYTNYVDVYATASQYEPKKINGLNAEPHTLRHSDKGIDTDRSFRIKPGKELEPAPGQGSAKTQAFRHGYLSDEKVLEAYLRFDTLPLLEKAGETEFVAGNVMDMDPLHHDYITVAEGSKISKEETSTLTVTDGIAFSTSETVSTTIGAEITQQLGGEIGIEGLGTLKGSEGFKTSLQASASKTVGTTLTNQIQKSRQIKTNKQFDKPGEYAIVPTCRVWKTPVLINTCDADGKVTGKKKGFLYTVLYNPTSSTAKAPGGKVAKHVLDMTPEEFEKDPEAQKELFAMAKGWRDRQQSFAEGLMAENKVEGGKVKSILKRDNLDEFVKGIIDKCKRNGYVRIGEMDDIVRGRFDLRSEQDVNTIAAAMTKQTTYPVKLVVEPRRPQKGGGYGYPRWHIILRDPETRLTHEWQIGTRAVTEVFETAGINVPDEMKPDVKAGKIKNDLHDIEYDIFYGIKKQHPDVHSRYNLPEFHAKVDQVAAEAGRKGDETPELKKKIAKLHEEAADHLQKLVDEFGIDWIRKFYH